MTITVGVAEFSMNQLDIITAALESCGAVGDGESISAGDYEVAVRHLNMLVKQWQGTADFAPGLKAWSRKRATLFLALNSTSYDLGPSGDPWATTYSSTTLSGAEASGQTVLSITSTSGIAANTNIGVVLDSGDIHWTYATTTGVGTVTVNDQLPSAAASGNKVYFYTAQGKRPISIIHAALIDENNQETPLTPMDVYGYAHITDKTQEGDPTAYYYEGQLTNGVFYLDSAPQDTTKKIAITYLAPIQSIDLTTDTPDYSAEWYRPLVAQLAIDLCVPFKLPVPEDLRILRNESLSIAQNVDPETTNIYFQPGL